MTARFCLLALARLRRHAAATAVAVAALVAVPVQGQTPTPTLPSTAAGASPAGASPLDGPRIVAVEAAEAPRIDGVLDDAVWQTIVPTTDFRQRAPVDLGAPSEATELRIAYDAKTLYIGLELFDREPHKIRAAILERGGRIDKDDNVRIAIDTYFDRKNAYIFEMNPLGTQDDALLTDERTTNWDWDGVYVSEARITPRGWTLEVAIPFTTIRFPEGEAPLMGIAVQRTINRKNEELLFPGIARDYRMGFFQVSQYARLEGLRGIRRGRGIEIKPYVLAGAAEAPPAPGRDRRTFERQIGGDAKVSLTSSLLLDLTLNTDFAQVEADAAQINLTRFNLFFPEKREFFLERAGLFQFGEEGETETFFSRRIGLANPIAGGARVTGQAGPVGVGLLNLQTREARDGTPGANYGVVRLQSAVGPRASVGMIATNVEAARSSYANRAAGIDGVARFWGDSSVRGWFTGVSAPADSTQPDRQNRAGGIELNVGRDVYSAGLAYTDIGRGFDPGIGFVARDDYRRVRADVGYRPILGDGSGLVRRLAFAAVGGVYTGHDGRLQTRVAEGSGQVIFRARDRVSATLTHVTEVLDAPFSLRGGAVVVPVGRYDDTNLYLRANTDESRRLYARAGVDLKGFFDGTERGVSGAVGGQASRHLKGEASARLTRIDHPSGTIDAAVLGLRLDLAANRKLFAATLVQYDNFTRLVRANVRVDWIHTPGADLFVVFNTAYRADPNATLGDVLAPSTYGLIDRTGIVKLTYRFAV